MKNFFYLLILSILPASLNAQVTITPQVQLIKGGLNSGGQSAYISEYKAHNGKLYFNSYLNYTGVSIWASDGTTAGTNILMSLDPKYRIHSFCPAGNKLVFLAYTGTGFSYKSNIYSTDGTVSGTTAIASNVLVSNAHDGSPDAIIDYNGKAYFSGNDGIHGPELWVTDGTTAGTMMIKDIAPGPDSSRPMAFAKFNNKLYFITSNNTDRYYLYTSDGTANGTVMIKDIVMTDLPIFPHITGMYEYNNRLYFTLYNNAAGTDLYATDGTAAGTTFIKNMPSNSDLDQYTVFNNKMYYVAKIGSMGSSALWETDGTPAGTQQILFADEIDVKAFNNRFFIGVLRGNGDGELISNTNGSATGTMLYKVSGNMHLYPHDFVISNNVLYFLAPTNHSNSNILSTDGTVAGTVVVGPHDPTFLTHCYMLTSDAIFNDSLYFEGKYYPNGISTDLHKLHLKVDSVVGINEIVPQQIQASLYPNPSGTSTTLNYRLDQPETVTVSITDLTGRTLFTATQKQKAGIHVEKLEVNYSPGVYMVHVNGERSAAILKLVVQ